MDKIELAFESLENLFSNISDEELDVLVNEVDNVNEKGLSVDEYFTMVMSDYHHTFVLGCNNPISNKILENYKIVGGVFKKVEKIKIDNVPKNKIKFYSANLIEDYHCNDFNYDIAA